MVMTLTFVGGDYCTGEECSFLGAERKVSLNPIIRKQLMLL